MSSSFAIARRRVFDFCVARQKPVHGFSALFFLKEREVKTRAACGVRSVWRSRKHKARGATKSRGMPSVTDLPDQPLRLMARFLGSRAGSLLGCCTALRARSARDALLWRPCLDAALATKEGRARLRAYSKSLIARFPAFHSALPLELAEHVHAFAVSPDGSRVAYESGASINVVNASTFDRVARCEYSRPMIYGLGLGLCFSFDGALLALRVLGKCAGWLRVQTGLMPPSRIEIYDALTCTHLKSWTHENGESASLGFLRGDVVVTGGHDGRLVLWQARTAASRAVITSVPACVVAIAVAPSTAVFASGHRGGLLYTWSIFAQRMRALKGHTHAVVDVAFVSEAALASVSRDGECRTWNLQSGQCTLVFKHAAAALSVTVSSAGLMTVSTVDGCLRLTCAGDQRVSTIAVDAALKVRFIPASDKQLALVQSENRLCSIRLDSYA